MTALAIATPAFGAWETRLFDDFDNPLTMWVWRVDSAFGGRVILGNESCLLLRGGSVAGTSTSAESGTEHLRSMAYEYRLTVRATCRSPLDATLDAFWGLSHGRGDDQDLIGFRVIEPPGGDPELWAEVRRDGLGQMMWVSIFHRDIMAAYRIDIVGHTARFFVDGELVAAFARPWVPRIPLRVLLSKDSTGIGGELVVDRVVLHRKIDPVSVDSDSWGAVKARFRDTRSP